MKSISKMELLEVNASEVMKAFMGFDKAEIHARSAHGTGATEQEIAESVLALRRCARAITHGTHDMKGT